MVNWNSKFNKSFEFEGKIVYTMSPIETGKSAFGINEIKNIRIWRLVAHFDDLLHGR